MESPSLASIFDTRSSQGSTLASRASTRPSRRFDGVTWVPIDHRANIKRGSKISEVWQHGGEYIDLNNPQGRHRWVCDRCGKSVKLPKSNSTSNATRHLWRHHQIRLRDTQEDSEEEDEEEEAIEQRRSALDQFISRVDIERFRDLLVRWVVQCQVPFVAVGRSQFAELLLCAQPYLRPYLTSSSNTIGNWVRDDYQQAVAQVRQVLSASKSKIHLSFDI